MFVMFIALAVEEFVEQALAILATPTTLAVILRGAILNFIVGLVLGRCLATPEWF